jgi:hypothetical protein
VRMMCFWKETDMTHNSPAKDMSFSLWWRFKSRFSGL